LNPETDSLSISL